MLYTKTEDCSLRFRYLQFTTIICHFFKQVDDLYSSLIMLNYFLVIIDHLTILKVWQQVSIFQRE